MRNKAVNTVKKYNMLHSGERIVVGLSGGADSCALLHFLVSLRDEMNLTIYACHINHLLRGEESDRDERFAAELCQKYKVELLTLRADVKKEAEQRHISTEQCGREIRYQFFAETAERLNAKIATAHTASDNAETVIFNLARGSGIAGLCGIPPVRDNIIRPLITVTRAEIEEYCAENHLSYVTDSTNLTHEYTRNQIRLDVVPVLKNINPSLEASVSGMSERMYEADRFIKKCAAQALEQSKSKGGYRTAELSKLDNIVFSEAVRILLKKFDIVPEAKHIELVRKIVYNNGAVEIRKNIFAVSRQGLLRIFEKKDRFNNTEFPFDSENLTVDINRNIKLKKINLLEFNNRKKINKFLFHNSLDYDTIHLTSVFRTRRSGDTFRPINRNLTKPLRKLMTELKIPSEQRDDLLLLADGSEVIWAEGIGVSERFAVSASTENVLVISVNTGKRKQNHTE